MSYNLLNEKIISTGKCIQCGACARACKHISMVSESENEKGSPKMTGKCIMTQNGVQCGNCYLNCPVVKKEKKTNFSDYAVPRELILDALKDGNAKTIPALSTDLKLSSMDVRFEVLRLVELQKVKLKTQGAGTDPLFVLL